MKKALYKAFSCITAMALLFSVFAFPLVSSAAEQPSEPHLHLIVEGISKTYFDDTVGFQNTESLYKVLTDALDGISPESKTKVGYSIPDTSMGHYISSIGSEAPGMDAGWFIFVNDAPSDGGVDSTPLKDGDIVTVAVARYNPMTYTAMNYPEISLSRQYPTPGSSETVTVKTADVSGNLHPVAGASVSFNGRTLFTNSTGQAVISVPENAGTYPLAVRKGPEEGNDYPEVVGRMIPITVSADPADCTIGAGDTDRTVNSDGISRLTVNGGGAVNLLYSSGELSMPLNAEFTSGSGSFSLRVPSGTKLSGSNTISLSIPSQTVAITGGIASMVVSAGGARPMALSDYARICLIGQSRKSAGFIDESGYFHKISAKLTQDAVPKDFTGEDTYYDDGSNLIIYTKHFSTFIAYTPSSGTNVSGAIGSAAKILGASGLDDYWTAFTLARCGYAAPSGYLHNTAQTLSENGGSFPRATALAMNILALRAVGADPEDFNGFNLVKNLYQSSRIDATGLNGPAFALLALDSGKYAVPAGSAANGSSLIAEILSYQNPDGGFPLSKNGQSDPDITAMALTALAPHRSEASVFPAVSSALSYLHNRQTSDGGYIAAGGTSETCESAAWAVIALSSLGLDPAHDYHFIQNGHSVLENLMSFRLSDGSFSDKHGSSSDMISTQQALMGLEAYRRYLTGSPLLFDLSSLSASIKSAAVQENPKTGSSSQTPAGAAGTGALVFLAAAAFLWPTGRKLRQN